MFLQRLPNQMCRTAWLIQRYACARGPFAAGGMMHVSRKKAHWLAVGDKSTQFISGVFATANRHHFVTDRQM